MGSPRLSLGVDRNTVLLGGAFDAPLDRRDFGLGVLGGVVLVVDVAPGRADVLGGVDRVLVVDRVGERDVAVFVLAALGVDVLAPVDLAAPLPLGHRSS